MDRQLQQFLHWARRRLRHLEPEKCREVVAEVAAYLEQAQQRQNISYRQLISSLGDPVQFLNGFLLKLGEPPLPSPRRWPQVILTTLATLTAFLAIGGLALYHYIGSQFDLNWDDGQIKLFGQTIDIDTDQVNLAYSTSGFDQKYVRKHSSVPPQTHFQIKLHHTRTTLSFHPPGHHFYTVECEMEHDRELALPQGKKQLAIEVAGNSNCDLTLPRASTLEADFHQGHITIERPASSFTIRGNHGHILWIKDQRSRFKIFYDVQNGSTRGSIDDIFYQEAPREAHIQLQNGTLSFERP